MLIYITRISTSIFFWVFLIGIWAGYAMFGGKKHTKTEITKNVVVERPVHENFWDFIDSCYKSADFRNRRLFDFSGERIFTACDYVASDSTSDWFLYIMKDRSVGTTYKFRFRIIEDYNHWVLDRVD